MENLQKGLLAEIVLFLNSVISLIHFIFIFYNKKNL